MKFFFDELNQEVTITPKFVSPEFLSYLVKNPDDIDVYRNILDNYFFLKTENLEVFSDDEISLLDHFSVNEERIVRVEITEELIAESASNIRKGITLNDEIREALLLYINDKITDEIELNEAEKIIFNEYEETFNSSAQEISTVERVDNVDFAIYEYGYNIYDADIVISRLNDIRSKYSDKYPPLTNREIRVIKRIWKFDPENDLEVVQFMQDHLPF